jgi:predicted  nucleic acid-binding Zn-ribbon protein
MDVLRADNVVLCDEADTLRKRNEELSGLLSEASETRSLEAELAETKRHNERLDDALNDSERRYEALLAEVSLWKDRANKARTALQLANSELSWSE